MLSLTWLNGFGQQQLGQRRNVKSPVVNADGSVTFSIYAPKAQSVSVNGDFEEIRNRQLDMTKQDNGVWTVTTGPLAPELYSYSLTVDGQRCRWAHTSPRATIQVLRCTSDFR